MIFPDSIRSLDNEILANCITVERVKLPQNLKKIKRYDFANCILLEKIEIPKSVESVCMSAFGGTRLKVIDLPENVTTIKNGNLGRKVFVTAKGEDPVLKRIIIRSKKIKKIGKNSFSGLSSKVVIRVPKSKLKKYKKMLYGSGLDKDVKVLAITGEK